ncbi:DUF1707 SHOCT-like domain-containing protein [Streptomyces violens]|uniref:DUF1707 SHOCT-like domain-containing protein n=1 Tax=Streptomyces violens TaxID=66377 RepID=UPI00068A6579|nr:DUF1707 domain-containing protein [Streptomyces violens]
MDLTKPVQAPLAEAAIRASDADRDRIAAILREALAEGRLDAEEHAERIDGVYRAKTMGELEPLIGDLPAGRERAVADRTAAAYAPEPPAGSGAATLVGLLSSAVRKGRWRAPARISAVAVLGSVEIDLTEALFTHQHLHINAVSVLGSVEIRVPENVTLHGGGSGVLGSFEAETYESDDPAAPVITVNGFALLGSVEARPKRGKWVRDLQDRMHGRLHGRTRDRGERRHGHM